MNREQQRLLRDTLAKLRRRRKWAWWELKRQIFDAGYQTWYPAQDHFLPAVEQAFHALPDETLRALIAAWRKAGGANADDEDRKILDLYPALIMEELVERARAAAYRTIHW